MKQDICTGTQVVCSHKVYYAYVACPNPQDTTRWIFSDCKSYTNTFRMTDCDTASWLADARAFDERRRQDASSSTWEEFSRLYPNECGCK